MADIARTDNAVTAAQTCRPAPFPFVAGRCGADTSFKFPGPSRSSTRCRISGVRSTRTRSLFEMHPAAVVQLLEQAAARNCPDSRGGSHKAARGRAGQCRSWSMRITTPRVNRFGKLLQRNQLVADQVDLVAPRPAVDQRRGWPESRRLVARCPHAAYSSGHNDAAGHALHVLQIEHHVARVGRAGSRIFRVRVLEGRKHSTHKDFGAVRQFAQAATRPCVVYVRSVSAVLSERMARKIKTQDLFFLRQLVPLVPFGQARQRRRAAASAAWSCVRPRTGPFARRGDRPGPPRRFAGPFRSRRTAEHDPCRTNPSRRP